MQKESWERALDERRPWTDAEAARAVAACDASGMAAAEFGRLHGVTAGKLYWWRKKLAERGHASSRLLPVRVVTERGATESALPRVVLSDGRLRLELEGISPEWLAALIRLVRESE